MEGAQCWPAMLARCGAGACRQGHASPSSRSGAEGRVAAVVCIRAVLAGVNTRLACIAASGQSPRFSNPVAPQNAAVFERECTGSDAFLTWQGDVPSPITHQQFNNLCYNWQKASGRGGGAQAGVLHRCGRGMLPGGVPGAFPGEGGVDRGSNECSSWPAMPGVLPSPAHLLPHDITVLDCLPSPFHERILCRQSRAAACAQLSPPFPLGCPHAAEADGGCVQDVPGQRGLHADQEHAPPPQPLRQGVGTHGWVHMCESLVQTSGGGGGAGQVCHPLRKMPRLPV